MPSSTRARGSTRRGTRRVQDSSTTTRQHPNGSAEIAFRVERTCLINVDPLLDLITVFVVTNNEGTADLNEQVAAEAQATPLAQPGPAAQLAEGLFAIEEEVPHMEGMLLLSLFF